MLKAMMLNCTFLREWKRCYGSWNCENI